MTYQEAIAYLYELRMFGTKLGLENTFRLARLCGDPHQQLRFIHVAGTNGKGSTCAMLESIYRHAGFKTGLFTSPHLVSFTERIQVNRLQVSQPEVVRLVERLLSVIAEENRTSPAPLHPTFFEFVTVMALIHFQEHKCELVLWEVGMGGRLDATNIVLPLASVITNIQYDHQRWLGDTLEQIAFEKAGIIKPGVPVITGVDRGAAREVIQQIAATQNAPLHLANESSMLSGKNDPPIALAGPHQRKNAAVVLKTVQVLQKIFPVDQSALRSGLKNTSWPGRLQLIHRSNSTKVLLDGAHNIDGVRALRVALEQLYPHQQKTLVIGMFADKSWREMAALIVPLARRVLICPVQSQRSTNPSELAAACRQITPASEIIECKDVWEAIQLSANDPFTVVTGSLHFIGEAMEALGVNPATGPDEKGLNEWQIASPR